MMQRIELRNGWTVQAYAGAGLDRGVGPMPATVPGAVHADLMAAGLIADPLLDRNEELAAWVGHTNWRYELPLEPLDQVEPGTRLDLVFGGIDTSAVIALDGVDLLATENMHRSYRVDATSALAKSTAQALSVSIESPWVAAERHRDHLGDLPNTYDTPYNFLRTMACSFGWDWGPTVPGAALWRPVFLERWSVARLASVRPLVRVSPSGLGAVTVTVDLEYADAAARTALLEVSATLTGPDGRQIIVRSPLAPGQTVAEVSLLAEDVELWWPHTLGDPIRYGLTVALAHADGAKLDTWERKIGFRTIELDTTPDGFGSAFTLVINGQKIFTKGLNWIPDDPFPARITPEQYADQVLEAVVLGSDLLRIWGGGIYESEDFYEACDRLGVMVWQDFAFACAAYPEEEPFATEVAAEATEAVTRLMPHPSLVLWCGNNENLWGYADWEWADQIGNRAWGKGFYLDVLPEIVGRIDPTRAYWAGSPWSQSDLSPSADEIHPNDPRHGCTHEWEVWNRIDLDHYRDQVPRFLSEFGWQAAPTWATLREALTDEPLTASSPGVQAHQKAEDGDLKLARGLAEHTIQQASGPHGPAEGGPDEGPDWVYRTQVVQALAVTTGIEHLRSHRGRCMGAIWWQLNDCWPSISWSVIDKARRRKLAWFALRRAYQPRLLTVQPRETGLAAVLVNDTPFAWRANVGAERLSVSGRSEVRAHQDWHVEVPAYDVVEVPLSAMLANPDEPTREVLRVRADDSGPADTAASETAWWWFMPAAELDLPHPAGEVTIEPTSDGLHIEVRARTHIRDLCLLPDHLHPDATVEDNLLTLADGEVANFRVRLPSHADHQAARDAVLAGQALRCLGDGPRAFRIVTPFLTPSRTGAR